MNRFLFQRARPEQEQLILSWLQQDYIQEWLHGDGLENTLKDLNLFLQGKSSLLSHFIAYDGNIPFAYLLTSEIVKNCDEEEYLTRWCSKEGQSITLDLFICNPAYLGKGIAHIMIQEFLAAIFPHADEVLIDPEATNSRAIHVYQKAGFEPLGEFIAPWHPQPHLMMRLKMAKNY